MRHIIKSAFHKIFKFFRKKLVIWSIIILLVIAGIYFIFFRGGNGKSIIQVGAVERQDLVETVLATGQVVSQTDLNLSFQASGIVRKILVKEGDPVKEGQVLATLDQTSALASLTTARGSLLQAQANYDKLVEGATVQDIKVYEDAVEQAQQDLSNAYSSAATKIDDAYIKTYNALNVVKSVQSNYFSVSDQQGLIVVEARSNIELALAGIKKDLDIAMVSSDKQTIDLAISDTARQLSQVSSALESVRNMADSGAYYSKVSSTDKTSLDTQKTNISTATSNITTSQQSIATYKIALQKSESQLNLVKAPPTQAEIDAAKAQIVSAQGQVDAANATINNLTIKTPADGTITRVGIRVGEQATSMSEVIDLQNVEDLYAEAYVSEANIASLKISQSVDYTFDALGPDSHFSGKILAIDPASTVISGVVNYKVKGSIENAPEIKPGMTANMTVMVAEKKNALAVPSTAVINKNNKKYVRILDDIKEKTYHEVQVQTGLQADGGVVEIVAGLIEGEQIIIYMR